MTPAAQAAVAEFAQVEPVGLMASRARNLAGVEGVLGLRFLVAFRAPSCDLCLPLGVRVVTSEAVSLALYRVRRKNVIVTTSAGCISGRPHRVRLMTVSALPMLLRPVLGQHPRSFVTGCALECAGRGERMCLMAGCAGVMPTAERCRWGYRGLLRGVALHAGRRIGRQLVPPMTIRAGAADA